MNGRVYDPLLARFGTADPMTESPFSTQGWNRYSYVGNSPLNFTDPSGYCFMGCFWKSAFKAIGNFFRENWRSLVQLAAAAACAPFGMSAVCAVAATTIITGITSGNLGLALRAGFIAAVTAAAFYGVGELTGGFIGAPGGGHAPLIFGSPAHLFNIAGHALVGCASAVANRGKCGPGALSGAVGSFAGPLLKDLSFTGKLVAKSVLGGLASVAGGGKFGNGALTAAFGYLFNEAGNHCQRGHCHLTPDDAARAVLTMINPTSIAENREYAGVIYELSGYYGFTSPEPGEVGRSCAFCAPLPDGIVIVGDYHTHGDYTVHDPFTNQWYGTGDSRWDDAKSDKFSTQDEIRYFMLQGLMNPNYVSYLGTPSGQFKFLDNTGNVQILK